MAHEFDITNGIASFANSRSDTWRRLGTSVGHAMTTREAGRQHILGAVGPVEAVHSSIWLRLMMPAGF